VTVSHFVAVLPEFGGQPTPIHGRGQRKFCQSKMNVLARKRGKFFVHIL
jgi:hypothetical protein